MPHNTFDTLDTLTTSHGSYQFYRLTRLEEQGLTNLARLPFSIRVMLESVLRQVDGRAITEQDAANIAAWKPVAADRPNMPFRPARVVMQDFTGVPAVVDLAAMRSAYHRLGGDPARINPLVPVDLVIDHSVQVDFFGIPDALARNAEIEFQRNRERYEFLHWGQKTFDNFRVVPPATGIVHQVNLEYLAQVVMTRGENGQRFAFPDTVVGTDSHTTMINGLGVAGWGVGGIEAEAAVLGQPIDMITPEVIGFKLYGELAEGVTATDLVLTATQMLREKGVVAKFVEYFGAGLDSLSLPDRATLANMSPEYGATMGFFPVDDETLRYLRFTGRSDEVVERVERYCKEQSLFRTPDTLDPEYTDTLELDLSTVEASLAGPKRPQDRVSLQDMKSSFHTALTDPKSARGFEIGQEALDRTAALGTNGASLEMGHGAVVIAAITSCTNTSNPSVMLAAGLVARNAIKRGMEVKPYVKTSLAPGSRVVGDYLEKADLIDPLAQLGFNIVGYGCTTCIGNSGPLPQDVVKAINSEDLVVAAVLSGNRNFEGRIHPYTLANYLASPPLVVAYALAGTVDINLMEDPIGADRDGNPVYLREIWPSSDEVEQVVGAAVTPEMFRSKYADVFTSNETWNEIQGSEGALYDWDTESTYIQEPPFFMDLTAEEPPLPEIKNARVLALLGDSLTTDHISPAGAIPADMPAGQYLQGTGVTVRDFNTFGARRGNHEVMMRGTFGNIRLKNRLVPGVEGGWTTYFPDNKKMTIYDASMKYQADGVPLIVLAGKEYGTGSSRDWAAKGSILLGVKAVIAQSYERIHRSNLIGMGVLPLQFMEGESAQSLGLDGSEIFDIQGLAAALDPVSDVTVVAHKADGSEVTFQAKIRIDTEIEVDYYRNGGILHKVLRDMVS